MNKWTQSVPVWSSRKSASGIISSWFMPLWWMFSLGLVVQVAATLWAVIALVVAVQTVLGVF